MIDLEELLHLSDEKIQALPKFDEIFEGSTPVFFNEVDHLFLKFMLKIS